MAYKAIQGFGHLPEVADYPFDDFLRDFVMDEDSGYYRIVSEGASAGDTGISVVSSGGRNFLCFRNKTYTGDNVFFKGGLKFESGALGLPRSGKWLFGLRVLTGPANAGSSGYNKVSSLMWIQFRSRTSSLSKRHALPYSPNMSAFITWEIDWGDGINDAVGVIVKKDGAVIENTSFAGTETVNIRFGNPGETTASGYYVSSLDRQKEDSYVGFTDYFCIHNEHNGASPTPDPGSVYVEPLTLDVQEEGGGWATSDEAKTPVEVLNEPLLPDGSNASTPFVTSDPSGGIVRFSIAPPATSSDILHVDLRALASTTEGDGQSAYQSTVSYRGSTGESRSHFPGAVMETNFFSDFSKTNTPDIWTPEDVGEVEVALNSYSISRPSKIPFDTGPGPSELLQGSPELGYFGTVDDVLTRNGLADYFDITRNSGTGDTFLKYIRKGKVCFIPTIAAGRSVSAEELYNKGLVYGDDSMGGAGSPRDTLQDARITVEGYTFKVRLLSFWELAVSGLEDDAVYRFGVSNTTGLRFSDLPPGSGGEVLDVLTRFMNNNPFSQEQWGGMPADYFGLSKSFNTAGCFLLQELFVNTGGTRLVKALDRTGGDDNVGTELRLLSRIYTSADAGHAWFPVLELTDE